MYRQGRSPESEPELSIPRLGGWSRRLLLLNGTLELQFLLPDEFCAGVSTIFPWLWAMIGSKCLPFSTASRSSYSRFHHSRWYEKYTIELMPNVSSMGLVKSASFGFFASSIRFFSSSSISSSFCLIMLFSLSMSWAFLFHRALPVDSALALSLAVASSCLIVRIGALFASL